MQKRAPDDERPHPSLIQFVLVDCIMYLLKWEFSLCLLIVLKWESSLCLLIVLCRLPFEMGIQFVLIDCIEMGIQFVLIDCIMYLLKWDAWDKTGRTACL
jgi:hypothetical protein